MSSTTLGLQKVKQNEFHAYDLILDQSKEEKLKRIKLEIKFTPPS